MASRCLHSQGHLPGGPVPPPTVPGPVCQRTCVRAFAEPFRRWLSKTCEEHSRECWETCGQGRKAGSVPGRHWARPGLPRGVLSSLLAWPSPSIDRPHARRHGLRAGKTLTSRDWPHVRHRASGGSRPPACRLAWPHPGPAALSPSLAAVGAAAGLCLPQLMHTGPYRAATCSGASASH